MKNWTHPSLVFALICLTIGFMLAILFQTNQNPVIRDTRDVNEVRISLQKERERTQFLLSEISKYDQLLYQYATSRDKEDKVAQIMEQEVKRIKRLAGFEDIIGNGFVLRIEKQEDLNEQDHLFTPQVYDEDLRMIVNELHAYGAKAISINEQRIVATTAIRNVGDRILVNTIPIQEPYELKVIGDSSILIPALKLAGLNDYFKIVSHSVQFEPKEFIRIPAFEQRIQPYYLEPVKEAKG
jgi:uncharacterized protein YlxW (UPF0749 family)